MSEKRFFRLAHSEARRRAMSCVADAPEGYVVTVQEPTRTLEQNAKFHALCSDVAKSHYPWAGKPRTSPQWKTLFVSGHSTATGEGADIVPGLESEFVNIRESTALMSKSRGASLITYTLAWIDMNGILVPERMAA